jgi:glutamyl-tRNA synthetase
MPGDRDWLARVVATLKERAKTLVELVAVGRFYFVAPSGYDDKAAQKFLTAAGAERLDRLRARLGEVDFAPATLEATCRALAEELGVKLVDLAQLSRLAVTGGTASPPIFDVLSILGREETLARLSRARAAIR